MFKEAHASRPGLAPDAAACAPRASLWSADPARRILPASGDVEWQVQTARRRQHRPADG
jgi:hypothetical protein